MTDEEINKRVAEIEGWEQADSGEWTNTSSRPPFGRWLSTPPPYVTDWAWCGPLVERYKPTVMLWAPSQGVWKALVGEKLVSEGNADTPQRAICLAVIAAHEGK